MVVKENGDQIPRLKSRRDPSRQSSGGGTASLPNTARVEGPITEVSLLSRALERGSRAERSLERGGWVGILEIQSPTGMSPPRGMDLESRTPDQKVAAISVSD